MLIGGVGVLVIVAITRDVVDGLIFIRVVGYGVVFTGAVDETAPFIDDVGEKMAVTGNDEEEVNIIPDVGAVVKFVSVPPI